MKRFIMNFFASIPLSIGIIFTIFSVVNALGVLDSDSHAFMAVLCGVIGIPLTYASILSLCKKPNV